jgi:hypothetical protein
MNFSQLQERVRLELLRRIERGTASVSLLARQTGIGQPHLSNFLHARRGLSLTALDKLLAAQRLTVVDLLPAPRDTLTHLPAQMGEVGHLPLVSHAVALFEPYIRTSSVQTLVPFPAPSIQGLRERCTPARKQWERFVVIRLSPADAHPMEPVLVPDALLVLDRHYISLRPYRESPDAQPNLYAIRVGAELRIRYADLQASRVILRPLALQSPIEAIEPSDSETANDLIVGRVVLILRDC